MKNLLVAAFSLFLLTVGGTAAAAPESPFFIGVMLGESTLDIQSHNYDPAKEYANDQTVVEQTSVQVHYEAQDTQRMSAFVKGGYSFLDWLAIEAQIVSSLGSDEIYGEVRGSNNWLDEEYAYSTMDVSSSAAGIYAVFQAGTEAFVTARVGVANASVKFETDYASKTFDSTHLSYGFSVGQQFGMGYFELIYMRYPDIEVNQPEFRDAFLFGEGDNQAGVIVRRRITSETMGIGYIFKF